MATSLESLALQKRTVEALERIADVLAPRNPVQQGAPGRCPKCGAPEEKQVDASTMGAPSQKKCLVCQMEYA